MKENKCFYYEIKGHHAWVCCKKLADCAKSSKNTSNRANPTVQNQEPIDMTPNNISSFLKENIDLLDEDTKLSIIESLMLKDFPQAQN